MDLDEKTEKIAALERELDFKEQQAGGMEQQIRELTHTKQWVFAKQLWLFFLLLNCV